MSIVRFLFPLKPEGTGFSFFLLAFRILFGGLLMIHGFQKWLNFSEMADTFPDPMGVGNTFSLGLAIFGELVCSIAFILGAFYRLAVIPMIFTMIMAFFVIHGGDPFMSRELPFVYMMVYIIMFFTGPGRFALDRMIAVAITRKEQ